MFSEQGWTLVSHVATFLKYSFTAATTALSVVSLRHDTTYKNSDSSAARELTPIGRYYLAGVISLAAITITTTIVGDISNSRLDQIKKEKAQAELNAVIQGQLDKQLQQGIKPVLQALGTDVSKQTKVLLQNLEKEAQESSLRLQSAQGHLLAQTEQSSQKLTALNTGMEASASFSREMLDRQQRLAEASSQVKNLTVLVTLPVAAPSRSTVISNAIKIPDPTESNVRKALFHGMPDIRTRLIVPLQYGRITVIDAPCSSVPHGPPGPAQGQNAPCLLTSGNMGDRLGPNNTVAFAFDFDVTSGWSVPVVNPDSALRLQADNKKIGQSVPPIRARDVENTGIFLTLCVTSDGALLNAAMPQQEAALRRLDLTLPSHINVAIQEMLQPLENGDEFSAVHTYTYIRATDRPSLFHEGCLQPFYQLSF